MFPHMSQQAALDGTRLLTMSIGGTECYDVSSMGTGRGLLGPTSKTLAVFLEQRRRAKEDGLGLVHHALTFTLTGRTSFSTSVHPDSVHRFYNDTSAIPMTSSHWNFPARQSAHTNWVPWPALL